MAPRRVRGGWAGGWVTDGSCGHGGSGGRGGGGAALGRRGQVNRGRPVLFPPSIRRGTTSSRRASRPRPHRPARVVAAHLEQRARIPHRPLPRLRPVHVRGDHLETHVGPVAVQGDRMVGAEVVRRAELLLGRVVKRGEAGQTVTLPDREREPAVVREDRPGPVGNGSGLVLGVEEKGVAVDQFRYRRPVEKLVEPLPGLRPTGPRATRSHRRPPGGVRPPPARRAAADGGVRVRRHGATLRRPLTARAPRTRSGRLHRAGTVRGTPGTPGTAGERPREYGRHRSRPHTVRFALHHLADLLHGVFVGTHRHPVLRRSGGTPPPVPGVVSLRRRTTFAAPSVAAGSGPSRAESLIRCSSSVRDRIVPCAADMGFRPPSGRWAEVSGAGVRGGE